MYASDSNGATAIDLSRRLLKSGDLHSSSRQKGSLSEMAISRQFGQEAPYNTFMGSRSADRH
jgi:hypothetical protein